ncbi:MAG TPA: glutathione peroxidase [Methanosphaera sp.]|nr:glutathione peroxidase [Methanosphaera sp.]HII09407.1 glutathione peroxidase [Methanosphaera sp.]
MMSIYDFNVKDTEGNDVSLSEYEGKVLLIVNSATECGFTPQYNELTDIYNEFKDDGFTILDFPCNQFGQQAPGTGEEIKEACRLNFLVEYPIFEKIDVNGENEDPLYTYLKSEKTFEGFDEDHELAAVIADVVSKIDSDYENNSDIKWNFTKFLVDREGNVVERYEPTKDLRCVKKDISELI